MQISDPSSDLPRPRRDLDPDRDGIDHINCWSKGKTALGRLLSNFALTPFEHPQYGRFVSVEGFWYWAASGMQHEHFRRLYGHSAKQAGLLTETVFRPESEFQDLIRDAIRLKIEQNEELKTAFIASTLPFEHYFVYPGNVVRKEKHRWQMDHLETLRAAMQEQLTPKVDPDVKSEW